MKKKQMIPEGLKEEHVRKRYAKEIEKHSDAMIKKLASLFDMPLESGVTGASTVVFTDEYGDGQPNVWLYLDGPDKKVDASDPTMFAGKSIELGADLNSLPMIDAQSYEESISVPDLIADLVKYWFAEMWWKAGGWCFPVPVDLHTHDDFGDANVIQLSKGAENT